jgi:hypothetical protein
MFCSVIYNNQMQNCKLNTFSNELAEKNLFLCYIIVNILYYIKLKKIFRSRVSQHQASGETFSRGNDNQPHLNSVVFIY